MREAVFIDTAGWLALGNKSDRWHSQAVGIYREITKKGCLRLTTDAVIVELCNALRKPSLRPLAVLLVDNIYRAERSGHLEVVHVTPELLQQGLLLFRSRGDKEWSLTDCISFVVMKQRKVRQALTTDHHFEQAGFERLLREA
ncbi:type II toxin-antitoxin system VapC family toxin [Ammonifex thiophilus]|uniref:PIN domain-containing protein n=1 Tax=Ammonifex thiophilus TaxID=444093 RepID=A0A3D8P120_9THEO|nr:PIN domain-containing protein [Ammonifex thiophilus]RDV80910.1 PIN domain-containing protein [Ammonifex thiophilus]